MEQRANQEPHVHSPAYSIGEIKPEFEKTCNDETKKKLRLLLVFAPILGLLAELAVFRPYPKDYNLFYMGFFVIFAVVLISYNWGSFRRSKEGWFAAAMMILLLANIPYMNEVMMPKRNDIIIMSDYQNLHSVLSTTNMLLAIPLCLVLISTLIGNGLQKDSVRYFLNSFGMNLIPNWFKNLPMPFRVLGNNVERDRKNIGKVMLGIVLGIPVFIVLMLLLASADDGLSNFLHNLPSLPSEWLLRVCTIAFMALTSYSMIASCLEAGSKSKRELVLTVGHWSSTTPGIIIAMMLIAYVIFAAFQFDYLSGFKGLPSEFTYSEYAVKGFNELNVVSFINIAMIVVSMMFCKDDSGRVRKPIRVLLIVLLVCSFLIAASALLRLLMYIGAYGLTSKRILAFWFEIAIFIVFSLAAIKLADRKFRVVYWGVGVLMIWYVLLNYIAPILASSMIA